MLILYRRHVKRCRYWTGKSTNARGNNDCRCPVWVDGYLAGERVNKTLDTRNWTLANGIIRDWEIAGAVTPIKREGMPVIRACEAFLRDAEARDLSDASIKKYRVLLTNEYDTDKRQKFSPSLCQYCAELGIRFTSEISLPMLTDFRAAWKDGAIAGSKKLERLRAAGQFFVDRGWWTVNWATKIKRPKITEPPTMPYTHEEIRALLVACERFTDWHGHTGQENAHRLRAFVLFMLYSGLRIGDAASCPVERLRGHRLFLYTQKTKVPVFVPLPPFVVDALESCPRISEQYWFWTGIGSKETLAGNWRRTFRRLCQIAGVTNGHPHRFRDTFAVEQLLRGLRMGEVAALLGHSSEKITERHYAPWVASRQAQLESRVVEGWRNDPIANALMLASDTAHTDVPTPEMTATYSRHEHNEVAN